jgi:serine-type D-Ala-D-Ala carboxypeptidase (penicillin-binding protein 5/6)
MQKSKYYLIIAIVLLFPQIGLALEMPSGGGGLAMPTSANDLANMEGISAQAYIVEDAQTGQVLINKNADMPWTPASLTKLVTALVVLDTNPKLTKAVAMTGQDQTAGACSSGGACIRTKPGVRFTVDGLFHALLLPSANNAASALARSTGLTTVEFAALMNQKAASLGATSSHFNEPTGMDPNNQITAADYAKVVAAAFSNLYLRKIAGLTSYALRSTNNSRYNQTIKNTDKLLADSSVQILGAKTGYLTQSGYNFSALVNYNGQELAVVVLGEDHLYTAFDETKLLANLAGVAQTLALTNPFGMVLGTSTVGTTINN